MKIRQWRSVLEDVELTEDSMYDVTMRMLDKLLDGGEYIRKETCGYATVDVLKFDDPEHRHGSIREIFLREATKLDKAVILVRDALTDAKIARKK